MFNEESIHQYNWIEQVSNFSWQKAAKKGFKGSDLHEVVMQGKRHCVSNLNDSCAYNAVHAQLEESLPHCGNFGKCKFIDNNQAG